MADNDEKQDSKLDARTYFAAERTLLAWVRTGLAMMGFGFVVARFGLFLQELAAAAGSAHRGTGLSLLGGTSLVILGVAINVGAVIKHWRTVRRLERGQSLHFQPWSLGNVVAIVLSLFGILLAIYLIFGFTRPS